MTTAQILKHFEQFTETDLYANILAHVGPNNQGCIWAAFHAGFITKEENIMSKDFTPKFRVDKTVNPPKVYLQCTQCFKDIREIKMDETIDIRRSYYCPEHDSNVIGLNLPKS